MPKVAYVYTASIKFKILFYIFIGEHKNVLKNTFGQT